jgi:hypothetical protein
MAAFLRRYKLADVLHVLRNSTSPRKESPCVIKLQASRQNMRSALIRLNQPIHKK